MGGKNLIFKGVFYKTKYIFFKINFFGEDGYLGFFFFSAQKKKKKKKKARK
jgi:hypothetical protein